MISKGTENKEMRIRTIDRNDTFYPPQLRELKDAPETLYYIGNAQLLRSRCVAVVGSRTTTVYGRNTAREIGNVLGRSGITVVSGLAAGIDACAHEGALSVRGATIAVLGCGPDICYPQKNQQLKRVIEQQGLIVSEYPPGTQPMAYHFPLRNRIISGLSELTIVVQARVRSGALITAELAAEQGREVFAVPGNIDSQYHLGTNKLIQDGATAIASVQEIPELLGLSGRSGTTALESLTGFERSVYQMIAEQGELSADEICLQLSKQPHYVVPILSALELKGFLGSASGKFFLANH